jgi:hypothetical protein
MEMPSAAAQHVANVATRPELQRFVELLEEVERRPVVVISVAQGRSNPAIDVQGVAAELEDSVHLVVLWPEATFWLTDRVGKGRSVHSGWARVYPGGSDWRADPRLAPLIAPTPSNPRRAAEQIAEAANAVAFRDAARHVERRSSSGKRCVVTVQDIVSPVQVIVVDEEKAQGILRTYHLVPGLPPERLVRKGQQLSGVLTRVGLLGEFVPDPPRGDDPHQRAVEFVGDGVVTLARAESVSPGSARLLLHPRVPIQVAALGEGDLTKEVAEGDVVTVEVVTVDGELVASFSDELPQPAMPVLPGGPPWLEPYPPEPFEPPEPELETEQDVTVLPGGVGEADEVAALREENVRLETELARARHENRQLRGELRSRRALVLPPVYSDGVEQLRFELQISYLTRTEEGQRESFPWPEKYQVGPHFLESVEALVASGGIKRQKIIDVCAEVLCGRAQVIAARAVKPWTVTEHGKQATRPDGAVAMRVRLQTESAAARRLRYWKLPNGEIELDRVGVHDEGLT